MPALADVVAVFERWYEPGWAEGWDAVGLVCGDPAARVDSVLLAVDAVPDTVAEAGRLGAQLLVTHHPLLLTAVHGVPVTDPKGALVHGMIRTGTAHFVAHTNAEVGCPGVSDALADAIGLIDVAPLVPAGEAAAGGRGVGRIGRLPRPVSLRTFTDLVALRLPATAGGVKAAGDPDRPVERVALLAGSGSSLIGPARAAGADVLLTADVRHHDAVEAVTQRVGGVMALVDVSHWASEVPWLHATAARLRQEFGDTVTVTVSDTVTDPWTSSAPSRWPG